MHRRTVYASVLTHQRTYTDAQAAPSVCEYIACMCDRDKDSPVLLCFALVESRDEMCLNRDGDITSWQAAPVRPWCLDQGHALIQS